jgi:hypothetical protein
MSTGSEPLPFILEGGNPTTANVAGDASKDLLDELYDPS